MKKLKGFRGKYFSLAAILALNTTVALASDAQSVVDNQQQLQTPKEAATSESEEVAQDAVAPVVVISKKIKEKKAEVYSASKSIAPTILTTDDLTVVTSEELSQKGFTTVADALNSIAGLTVTYSGGLGKSASVFMQGMSNQYTLLMVDGVRYNDPSNTSGADFSHLMIGDIDRIEIIKGAQSGVWGADAAAGVINIITKQAQEGTHASAGVEVGSYDHRSAQASVSHKTDRYDVLLSVQRVTEDGFTTQAPYGQEIDQYEKDPYRNTTVDLKVGYWIDAYNRIEAGHHDINAMSSYDNYTPDDNAHSDIHNYSDYVSYLFLNGDHRVETKLSQSSFHKKELDETTTGNLNDYQGKVPSLELKDTWKYLPNSTLVFGGSYEKRELTYTAVGDDEQTRNEHSKALFFNNTNQFDKLVLTEALRYDAFSAFENKMTGKVGVKYLFTNDFNVYANYGTAYRAPSMFEMIYPWGSYGMSNYALKPETIKSVNIGFQYAGLSVNFFRNAIEDMISAELNSLWKYQYVNIEGTSVMKGVEISYERQLFETLLMGANYTYVDAKQEDGTRLQRRPRYQTTLYATYMPIKQLAWNVNGTYIGSRLDQDWSTWPATDVDTGHYFVANTKLTYFIDKTWDVYVKVNNLFDRYYQSVYGYATAERSYYLGVEAKF